MKKLLLIGMLSVLAAAFAGAPAEAKSFLLVIKNHQLKQDARHVLKRTAVVLQWAQEMAREQRGRRGHHYQMGRRNRFYGLGLAFAHQSIALDLYQQGMYRQAIDHSLRARAIALQVMKRARRGPEWGYGHGWRDDDEDLRNCDMDRDELDDREVRYWDRRPDGSWLELELRGHEVSDDAAIDFHIEFDL